MVCILSLHLCSLSFSFFFLLILLHPSMYHLTSSSHCLCRIHLCFPSHYYYFAPACFPILLLPMDQDTYLCIVWKTSSQCPTTKSPVEGLSTKELTFLISPASLVTLCMSTFSDFLAQGGSRLLSLTNVYSNNKMPEAKNFSIA